MREKFGEVLVTSDRPIIVTKDGVPLGFFVPARVWKTRADSVLSEHLVELVLVHSEQTDEDVEDAIGKAGPRMQRYFRESLTRGSVK